MSHDIKILLFSDPHYSTNSLIEEEKWFPPVCSILPNFLAKKFLQFWDKMTQGAFIKMLNKAKRETYDLAIGLGDYTPGANESGMITDKSIGQFNSFKRILDQMISCHKILVWGDHDAGYRFEVSKKTGVKIGTEQGGMSDLSAENAGKLLGSPFYDFEMGPAKFFHISTNLIKNVDENDSNYLQILKKNQVWYLDSCLERSITNLNFVLLHDPTALTPESEIRKVLDKHKKKITAIIHGHLHAEFARKLTMLSPVSRDLCQNFKTVLVPASWGMMGIGAGYKVLEIDRNEYFKIIKHKS